MPRHVFILLLGAAGFLCAGCKTKVGQWWTDTIAGTYAAIVAPDDTTPMFDDEQMTDEQRQWWREQQEQSARRDDRPANKQR